MLTFQHKPRPTYLAERRVEGRRLAYYCSVADSVFWNQHWKAVLSREAYYRAEQGNLGWYEKPFTRYLPKRLPILEAGCGLGKYVLALRVRGYEAEGVEIASDTVKAVQALYPDLPIRVADVTRLDVPDGYYGGYISLGVMEHRREGPEPFLKEAYRLLSSGGVALISVPYFHLLRQLKGAARVFRGRPDSLEFYQYAFDEGEFTNYLRLAGFKVIDKLVYDGFKGIKDEIPFLRWMWKRPGVGRRLEKWIRSWRWGERHLGHMILFVCRKEEA